MTDPNTQTAADFEESPEVKIARLERTLAAERRHAARASRALHRQMARDLDRADEEAAQQRRAAARAERRAAAAEAELAAVRASATWRAGRALVAVPAAVRRRVGRG
ncbi:hypothetical protein [Nocardioides litoris]|uniref:hypothetical protein n=1 Tax=Nocardioides litoris TaxID=1926648 RepID=UPI00111F9BB9|nr:hypothetical protein [Nocardioides litoris]